ADRGEQFGDAPELGVQSGCGELVAGCNSEVGFAVPGWPVEEQELRCGEVAGGGDRLLVARVLAESVERAACVPAGQVPGEPVGVEGAHDPPPVPLPRRCSYCA